MLYCCNVLDCCRPFTLSLSLSWCLHLDRRITGHIISYTSTTTLSRVSSNPTQKHTQVDNPFAVFDTFPSLIHLHSDLTSFSGGALEPLDEEEETGGDHGENPGDGVEGGLGHSRSRFLFTISKVFVSSSTPDCPTEWSGEGGEGRRTAAAEVVVGATAAVDALETTTDVAEAAGVVAVAPAAATEASDCS